MTESPIDEAAFLGKLTAGATHEMRNVLSIIKESAGLMGDLLDMSASKPFVHEEKFRKMITNILTQVERGSTIAKELNTLAHAADDRMTSVDVQKILACQLALCSRFCRGREITLTLDPASTQAFIKTDPIRFHAAICSVIDGLMEYATPGSDISMRSRKGDESLDIIFTMSGVEGSPAPHDEQKGSQGFLAIAGRVAESLGGSLAVRFRDRCAILMFPLGARPK
jgi:signal transduction histidine kinase